MNSHGAKFHVHQKFVNMDEEVQDAGFDSDGGKGPFFDAVTGEETEETYKEEVLPEGVVPEDKTAAVDENPIVNGTIDMD